MTDAGILLLVTLAIGAALWLAGHRILRWATLLCGVICGAILANAMMAGSAGSLMILLWIIAGALVGAAASWLLFRVIAGTSMAVTLALLAMVTYTVWQQLPLPTTSMPAGPDTLDAVEDPPGNDGQLWQFPAPAPAGDYDTQPREPQAAMVFASDRPLPDMDDMAEDPVRSSAVNAQATITDPAVEQAGELARAWQNQWAQDMEQAADVLTDGVASRVQRHAAFGDNVSDKLLSAWRFATDQSGIHGSNVSHWWGQLAPVDHLALIAAALIAAIVGFVLGLSMPYMAAAGQSAMIGSALLLVSYVGFANTFSQRWDLPVPHAPQQWLLLLIFGTAAGILLQWWIWAPREDTKADKD